MPQCGEKLKIEPGIEVGHIFKLGQNTARLLVARTLTKTARKSRWYGQLRDRNRQDHGSHHRTKQ